MRKQGADVPELDGPPMPRGSGYLVEWFFDLSVNRRMSATGPGHIPVSEIQAWQQLTGNQLAGWEYRIIRAIDNLYINNHYGSRRTTD